DQYPTQWLVSTGLALLTASFALMLLVGTGTALWLLVGCAILGRIGLGFILPSLNLGAVRSLRQGLISQGSSVISFIRMLGGTAHHSDGWGIAFFQSDGLVPGKGARCFVDTESASTSALAGMLRAYPIKSHNVVAHVRKATVGGVSLENCHPFVRELWGRYW